MSSPLYTTHYSNPATLVPIDVAALQAAVTTIDIAAYSLTEPTIIAQLIARAGAGVVIRVYLDRSELEAEARGNPALPQSPLGRLLGVAGITVRVKYSTILMHLKSYLVDAKNLRDGSANFSPLGEFEQDNSLTLTDDPAAVFLFTTKFAQMWNRPDNLTVTQAVEGSSSYAVHREHSH